MRKLGVWIFCLVFLTSFAFAKDVYFFYGEGCPHCFNVEQSGVLERVAAFDDVSLSEFEIYRNSSAREVYLEVADSLGLDSSSRGVPMAVVMCENKSSYLLGDTAIIGNLETSLTSCMMDSHSSDSSSDNPDSGKITVWSIVVGALVDSINPCAFGVLIFLMLGLLKMGSPKRALKMGLIYSFVVFVVYFLIGLGILNILPFFSGKSYIFFMIAALVAVGGLIEIKDFFWYGKGFSLKIPAGAKDGIENLVQKGTLPAVLALGVFVSLVEAPCTGGVYIAILSLMSLNKVFSLGYLALYNFIFVLPLIVITLLIYRGQKVDSIRIWVEENKRLMRLVTGLIMIGLAYLLVMPFLG